MPFRDLFELLFLAAVWGASFLFMRLGAGSFGPAALVAVRVTGAALMLLPLAALHGGLGEVRRRWKSVLVVGLANSGIPFLCFAFAALHIEAGLSAIFNATTPLWGALIGWLWLGARPTPRRLAGLALGFAGVLLLAWQHAGFKAGTDGAGWAVLACLLATLLYGFAAHYAKVKLAGVAPLAQAAGSQFASAVCLLPLGVLLRPAQVPGPVALGAAAGLSLLCTGVAYALYFRIIQRSGAARAMSVTFLVPAFAALWGALFLHEAITASMVAGCAAILAGTALATLGAVPRVHAAAASRGA